MSCLPFLLCRTADQFRQVALAAGIPPEQCTVGADRTGVDLLLEAWKG